MTQRRRQTKNSTAIPVASNRQMVDDSEKTPNEDIHRVAAVATAAVAT